MSDAKNWMESSRPGLVTRPIIVDVGMSAKHQVSAKTRQTCKVITPAEAKQWSDAIKMVPITPIIDNVLIRPCQQGTIQKLHEHLEDTHKHLLSICVPISVPHTYWRHLRSAASRSAGPHNDMEKSGVDFQVRTIGKRKHVQSSRSGTADSDAKAAGDDENVESDNELDAENPEIF